MIANSLSEVQARLTGDCYRTHTFRKGRIGKTRPLIL